MHSCNLNRHQKKCVYKVELKETKANVLKALQNIPKNAEPPKNCELTLLELRNFLSEFFNKSKLLHKKVIENELRDTKDRIRELHVSDSTKEGYLLEYKLFDKWLNKNKKSLDQDSANMYLGSLKCRSSTLKKKQMILQSLLRVLVDPHFKLNPMRMKISFSPKYSLTDEEIENYLNEQKENKEMYLIQKLMVKYGLRINTPASLKIKHLHFREGDNADIFLPDVKVRSQRTEKIEESMAEEFCNFLLKRKRWKDEDYVFYQEGKNEPVRKRSAALCVLVNKRIKESKVLKKNPNFKYSSHMFRKTRANMIFQEGLQQLKEKSRKAIGQTSNSSAIEHYITY